MTIEELPLTEAPSGCGCGGHEAHPPMIDAAAIPHRIRHAAVLGVAQEGREVVVDTGQDGGPLLEGQRVEVFEADGVVGQVGGALSDCLGARRCGHGPRAARRRSGAGGGAGRGCRHGPARLLLVHGLFSRRRRGSAGW